VILQTERLTLRRFTEDDLDTLGSWLADPVFSRYLGGVRDRSGTVDLFERVQSHWAEHGFGPLAVTDRETGELVGRGGAAFHRMWPADPEVGWWTAPAWQGRGLATEAGAAAVAWAFGELGFERVVSISLEGNLASRAVMARLGFALHERVPSEWGELWVHAREKASGPAIRRPGR
jgi:RimJ/RimL family protein N-acetyltransferase